MVAAKTASSGMTFSAVPAWKLPTLSTTGSKTSNRRVTMACRVSTASQAAGTGSSAECGLDPWPPRPRRVTSSVSQAAITGPGRVATSPDGSRAAPTCSA